MRLAVGLAMCLASGPSWAQQQAPPHVSPVALNIARVYDKGPDGLELYALRMGTIEPSSGALWLQYGSEGSPPIRIDRNSGAITTIGKRGPGPDEYQRIMAMSPGINSDVGIWEASRRIWFWVDANGRQARAWSLPTNSLVYSVFTDVHGNAFLGQPRKGGEFYDDVIVRIDSARGLVDTTQLPIHDDARWHWQGARVNERNRAAVGARVMHAPQVLWVIDRQGRINAAWTDSSYVIVREGTRERRIALPDYHEPLTRTQTDSATRRLDQFESSARAQGFHLVGPRPQLPTTRAQIDRLIPEMNGGIAVERSRPCSTMPDWRAPGSRAPAIDQSARCVIVERFDADGRRLRPFTLLYRDHIIAIRADTVWISRTTSEGFNRVVEMVVPKS